MVDPHVRTHQAVEYEMNTATAPEKTMAESRNDRFSAGLNRQYASTYAMTQMGSDSQVPCKAGGGPVFGQEGKDDKDGNREKVVVEHRIPIFESGDLDPLSHKQNLNRQLAQALPTGISLHRRQKQCS